MIKNKTTHNFARGNNKSFYSLPRNRSAAIEMSVGTIVTIVLSLVLLIGLLLFIQKIIGSGSNAIDSIDAQMQSQINQLFAESDGSKTIVIFPTSREITLKKGDDPKGFAFSIKNNGGEDADFTYTVGADSSFDFKRCSSTFTKEKADKWLISTSGSFSLGPGNSIDMPELVLFVITQDAPPCTIPYVVTVKRSGDSSTYAQGKIFVTIK